MIPLCFQLQTNPCNPGTSVGRRGGGGGVVGQLWMWVFLSWISIGLFKSPSEKIHELTIICRYERSEAQE